MFEKIIEIIATIVLLYLGITWKGSNHLNLTVKYFLFILGIIKFFLLIF